MKPDLKARLAAWFIFIGVFGGILGAFRLFQWITGPAAPNKHFGLLQKAENGIGYEAMLGSYDGSAEQIPGSGERFDVISAEVDRNSGITSQPASVVWVRIRSNDGSTLYLDRAEGVLEFLDRGKWRRLEWSENGHQNPLKNVANDSIRRYAGNQPYFGDGEYADEEGVYTFSRITYPNVQANKYRLTLYFRENQDGTGQKYTLQLVLDLRGE